MQNENLDETMPSQPDKGEIYSHLADTQQLTPVRDESPAPEPGPSQKPRRSWVRTAAIGILIFVVISGVGVAIGYQTGIEDRVENEVLQTAVEAATQYQLGLQDMESGNFDLARQRFEFVIRNYPEYPGAAEQLTLAILASSSTATPTIVPTATLVPTADLRDIEEMYNQALAARDAEDWNTLTEILDSMRKANPEYRAVDVDGLYYLALRNRGVQRILQEHNLEGGIFDLTQAEEYGPIDTQAQSYRQWAEWYIIGASFWEIDWAQAVQYFGYVAPAAPQLSDGSLIPAIERLATAQLEYSYQLIDDAASQLRHKEWCEANATFQQAAEYAGGVLEPEVQPTANWASFKCDDERGVTPEP